MSSLVGACCRNDRMISMSSTSVFIVMTAWTICSRARSNASNASNAQACVVGAEVTREEPTGFQLCVRVVQYPKVP